MVGIGESVVSSFDDLKPLGLSEVFIDGDGITQGNPLIPVSMDHEAMMDPLKDGGEIMILEIVPERLAQEGYPYTLSGGPNESMGGRPGYDCLDVFLLGSLMQREVSSQAAPHQTDRATEGPIGFHQI